MLVFVLATGDTVSCSQRFLRRQASQRYLVGAIAFMLPTVVKSTKSWSGRRGSNPRPRPWQGRAPASTPCRTALLLSIKRSRGSERCNTICNTNRKSDRAKNAKSTRFYWLSCGRRIVVIQQLPNLFEGLFTPTRCAGAFKPRSKTELVNPP